MSKEGIEYLGICARVEPPLIGVYYRNKAEKDDRKRVYTILLQKLVLNPNVPEVVEQLYQEHPHILKEEKIPKDKIAKFVQKIQTDLQMAMGEYQEQQQEEEEHGEYDMDHDHFEGEEEEEDPHHQLNKSS